MGSAIMPYLCVWRCEGDPLCMARTVTGLVTAGYGCVCGRGECGETSVVGVCLRPRECVPVCMQVLGGCAWGMHTCGGQCVQVEVSANVGGGS